MKFLSYFLHIRYFLQPRDNGNKSLKPDDLGSLRLNVVYTEDHVFSSDYYSPLRDVLLKSADVEVISLCCLLLTCRSSSQWSEYLSLSCWHCSCVITREVSSSFTDLRTLLISAYPWCLFSVLAEIFICIVGEGTPRNTVVLAAAYSV